MPIDVLQQLRDWADTISIVSSVTGPVEPGQKVDLQILSSAREIWATDNIGNVPIGIGTGTLLPSLPVRLKVAWTVKNEADKILTPGTHYLITKAAHSVNSGQG